MKKKTLLFRAACLVIFLFCSFYSFCDKPQVQGYFINKSGETLNVKIQVYTVLFSDKLDERGHQEGFNYIDKKGKKIHVGHDEAEEYGFTYQGKKYVYHYILKKQALDLLGPFYKGQYCQLLLDGECRLYTILINGAKTNHGSETDREFLIWKNKGDLFISRTGMQKMAIRRNEISLQQLFSDCPLLLEKIKNKEFTKDEEKYERMVKFYNTNCPGDSAGEGEEESNENDE